MAASDGAIADVNSPSSIQKGLINSLGQHHGPAFSLQTHPGTVPVVSGAQPGPAPSSV